jgi:PAS domain S-box-containing protein
MNTAGFEFGKDHELQILRKVWEISTATIVVTDPCGQIEYVNPAFEKATGYSAEEVLGKNPRILKSGGQEPEVYAELWNTITSGRTWTGQLQNHRKDGSPYWERTTIAPVCDDGGQTLHYIAVKENVSEAVESRDLASRAQVAFLESEERFLKKHSQALQESERKFRALIEHAADGIALINGVGTMIYASPSARLMFGYGLSDPVDVIDPNASTHPDDLPGVLAVLYDLMRRPGQVRTMQYRFRRNEGGWQWIESCFSNLLEVPGVAAIVINFRNIDDRKRAETALAEANGELSVLLHRAEDLAVKAEAATRAKSDFLAVMSHELRTPLHGVLGFAELLADTPLDKEQQSFARTIIARGNHLLEIVSDILDFSSIERGGLAIESARIVIVDLVESACSTIRKHVRDKGLEFHCEISPGVPAQTTGDADRIRQILINLLGNAVKFTSSGSIALRIASAPESGVPAVTFSVEDTGPGISPEVIEQLFQPFTLADSTTCRPFEGTGLGLAISQRLAEAMGGKITLASKLGWGSVFTLRLPVECGASPTPGKPLPVARCSLQIVGTDGHLAKACNKDQLGKKLVRAGGHDWL